MLAEVRSRINFDEVSDIQLLLEKISRRVLERNPSGVEVINSQNIAMLLTKMSAFQASTKSGSNPGNRNAFCCYCGENGVDFRTHKSVCTGRGHTCSECSETGHLESVCEKGAERRELLSKRQFIHKRNTNTQNTQSNTQTETVSHTQPVDLST